MVDKVMRLRDAERRRECVVFVNEEEGEKCNTTRSGSKRIFMADLQH